MRYCRREIGEVAIDVRAIMMRMKIRIRKRV